MSKKNTILDEMVKKQVKNIEPDKMLAYNDMCRIVKNINTSLFSTKSCCIWTGYVTNVWNHKSTYINFYFNKKKIALHRLLYNNFIGSISDTEYIKYSCTNRGRCCNVTHFIKLNKEDNDVDSEIDNDKTTDNENNVTEEDEETKVLDKDAFTIYFD